MARIGVEYEEIARIADGLVARGVEPTNRLVLAEAGGSATTVHRHLKAWRAAHPPVAAGAPELPASLQRALQEELRRIQAEARADLEARLVTAQTEAEDLARESERVQGETEALREQLSALSAERERLAGQAAHQAEDLERLQRLLEDERRGAEAARVDLAQSRLKTEAQRETVDALRNERESQRNVIETERAGRIEAARSLAGAEAARDTLRQHVDQMLELNDDLEKDREQLQQQLDTERRARSDAERNLAGVSAEAKAAIDRANDLQRREEALRADLQRREAAYAQALEQVRELTARESNTTPPRDRGGD